MAYPTHQQYADLAKDAYENRRVTGHNQKGITIGGNEYKVLAVADDRSSGYQGTVYLDLKNNAVIVAHRGTESPKADWKDAVTDAVMVLSRHNGQAQAAVNLTKEAMDKIKVMHQKDPSKPMPTISHAGHSLGGALAQISAHYFDHRGVTINAYGAASLGRIPEGGDKVVNYVKATDPVAAASSHYGSVVVLATQDEINRLATFGYTNSKLTNTATAVNPAVWAGKATAAAAASVASAHSSSNFTGSNSILSNPQAKELALNNQVMIESYRSSVESLRVGVGLLGVSPKNIKDAWFGDRPAGEPARKNLPPLAQSSPVSLEDLPLNAQNIHKRIEGHLTGYYEQSGLPVEADKIRNAAMALTAACCEKQMKDAPLFAVKDDRFLVGEKNPFLVRASMDMAQAEMMQPEESMKKIHETQQRFEHEAQSRQMEQARGISMV